METFNKNQKANEFIRERNIKKENIPLARNNDEVKKLENANDALEINEFLFVLYNRRERIFIEINSANIIKTIQVDVFITFYNKTYPDIHYEFIKFNDILFHKKESFVFFDNNPNKKVDIQTCHLRTETNGNKIEYKEIIMTNPVPFHFSDYPHIFRCKVARNDTNSNEASTTYYRSVVYFEGYPTEFFINLVDSFIGHKIFRVISKLFFILNNQFSACTHSEIIYSFIK